MDSTSESTLVLERTLEDSGLAKSAGEPLQESQQVGRFIIQSLIGAGATGHVYKAWDPELHRSVALKLLVAQLFSAHQETNEHTTRLRLEAQALARLNHPHVVTVHEVGTHAGAVFVAMEFVEGATLRGWLHEKPRAEHEVLSVMLDAASGIIAAHEAGIIHRDFKPDNVMVPISGGLKIVDFGLARPHTDGQVNERAAQLITPPARAHDALRDAKARPYVTTTGALVGTPAYMAPEVLDGAAASPASDQYAFGVTLYEALFGERPYRGMNIDTPTTPEGFARLAPPRRSRTALRVLTVIQRMLAPDPKVRFPSVRAARDALVARERGAERRRRLFAWSAVALLVGLVIAGALAVPDPGQQACVNRAQQFDSQWSRDLEALERRGRDLAGSEGAVWART
ncbi:MAG: serine/threonine-protein kinase, partial [Nannocystaceae bacterium]